MVPIQSAQYANPDRTLVYVIYADGSYKFVRLGDGSTEAEQLAVWVAGGGVIGPYVPIISGGIIPIATIMWFCAQRPPAGYLLCDGSAVSRSRYTQLFRAIGTTFGEGNGSTTFNLPNLVGRFVRGWGPVSPLDPTRVFGSEQADDVAVHTHGYNPVAHTHTITDPTHTHTIVDPGHTHPLSDPGHIHQVTDPGHQHISGQFSHAGYSASWNILVNGAIQFGGGGLFYGRYDYYLNNAQANLAVFNDSCNPTMSTSTIGEFDSTELTGVTINTGETNIVATEQTGGTETRPKNIALLPVIRY